MEMNKDISQRIEIARKGLLDIKSMLVEICAKKLEMDTFVVDPETQKESFNQYVRDTSSCIILGSTYDAADVLAEMDPDNYSEELHNYVDSYCADPSGIEEYVTLKEELNDLEVGFADFVDGYNNELESIPEELRGDLHDLNTDCTSWI